jgi:hypothetical protein
MELHQEPLPGDDSISAALYGPLVLAADLGAGPADGPMKILHGGGTEPKDPPAADPLPKAAAVADSDTKKWVQVDSASDLRFTAAGESSKYQVLRLLANAEPCEEGVKANAVLRERAGPDRSRRRFGAE